MTTERLKWYVILGCVLGNSLATYAVPLPPDSVIELSRGVQASFDAEDRGVEFQPKPGLRCRWEKSHTAKPVFEYIEKLKTGVRLIVPGGTRLRVVKIVKSKSDQSIEYRFESEESILTALHCKGEIQSLDQVLSHSVKAMESREIAKASN